MNDNSLNRPSMKEIFFAASDLPSGEEREAYLRQVVGDDTEILQGVRQILADAENRSPNRFDEALANIDLPTDEKDSSSIDVKDRPVIGPYKLVHNIGDGGMGEVFIAEQREPIQRTVALKLIKRGMDSDDVLARFEAERQALAMMDHPNIAKVLDAGQTHDGLPYFVMDLVRGIPITEYCDQHKLDTRVRLELLVKICQAVQHAHQKGIIHRDLKPSNILVELHDVRHVPKVIDFGVAKAINQRLTERTLITHFHQMVGTPLYMSPEQAELSGQDVDTRSDVYSLGVLMYELLTGTTPFDKETLRSASFDEMRRIIREDDPPRPSHRISTFNDAQLSTLSERQQVPLPQLKQSIERELDWIVLKALEKDRTRRYESASALAADIQRYLEDQPVEACPPSAVYRFGKLARRHKAAITTIVMVAAALVVGVVGTGYQAMRATRAELEAVQEATRAETEAETAKRESAISQAVNEFINSDLLGAADPHVQPNRDLRVREVLDKASQKIGNRFQDQPLVEASIRHTLGNSFLNLGELDTAESQLKSSLKLYQQELGNDDARAIIVESQLAWLDRYRGEYQASYAKFQSVLKRASKTLGLEHRVTLSAKSSIAYLTMDVGRYKEAETICREVLEIQHRVLGSEDADTLVTTGRLANILAVQGLSAKAEELDRKLLKLNQQIHGVEHPESINSIARIGYRLRMNFDYGKAEEYLMKAIEVGKRVFGPEHPNVLSSRRRLADVRRLRGSFEEATELYRETLDIQRRKLGNEHPDALETLRGLAWANLELARYKEAEDILQRTLEIRRRRFGSDAPSTLENIHDLGVVYSRQRNFEKAKEFFLKSYEAQTREQGEDSEGTLSSRNNLADTHVLLGEFDKAEELFQRQLEICQRKLGKRNDLTLAAMANLGCVLIERRRFQEAEELIQEALDMRREFQGREHPDTAATMHQLGLLRFNQDRYEESEKLFRQVLKIWRISRGDKHLWTLASQYMVSLAVRKQGRYAEAAVLWRQWIDAAKPTLDDTNERMISAKGDLAFAYRKLGRLSDEETVIVENLKHMIRGLGFEHSDTQEVLEDLRNCWAAQLDQHSGQRDRDQLCQRALEFLDRIATEGHDRGHIIRACLPLISQRRRDQESGGAAEEELYRSIANHFKNCERQDARFLVNRGTWNYHLGKYQLALEDFRGAQTKEPSDVAQRRIIFVLLQQGRIREAAAKLPGIDDLETTTEFLRKASVIAYAGDETLHRELCRRMLERFGKSNDVGEIEKTCKVCALLPNSIDTSGVPLKSLEKALQDDETSSQYSCWKSIACGLANFREGDARQAKEFIREAQTRNRYKQTPEARALATAVLAMVEHELGNSDLSKEVLCEAGDLIDDCWPKMLDDEFGNSWPDWLIAETLRREAELLILGEERDVSSAGEPAHTDEGRSK